jgi:hypothetical protein
MSNQSLRVLSESSAKSLGDALNADLTARNKWRKACDALVSDGVTSAMLAKPKKGETTPHEMLIAQVEDVVMSSFTKLEREIYAKEPKVLSDEQKVTRRFVQTEKGSRYNKIVGHMKKHETDEEQKATGAPKAIKGKVDKIKAKLNDAITLAQSLETPAFDVTDFVKEVKLCIAMVV